MQLRITKNETCSLAYNSTRKHQKQCYRLIVQSACDMVYIYQQQITDSGIADKALDQAAQRTAKITNSKQGV